MMHQTTKKIKDDYEDEEDQEDQEDEEDEEDQEDQEDQENEEDEEDEEDEEGEEDNKDEYVENNNEDNEDNEKNEKPPLCKEKTAIPTHQINRGSENKNQYCLEISTSQITTIKSLVEALKDLLIETSIIFDHTGMKINTIDAKHITVIHMKLFASQFERYHCEKPISIGVNMVNLYRITKTMNNGETLTFFMDTTENMGIDHLGIKIENSVKGMRSVFYLDLYELDPQHIEISPLEYTSIIHMPSNDFQKIIRDMSNLSQNVEICNVDNQLIFRCKGEFCKLETTRSDNPVIDGNTNEIKRNIVIYNKNINKITQGVFNLRYLNTFTKCTNLSSTVELNIENNLPLIIHYNIAALGHIKLCLAPSVSK